MAYLGGSRVAVIGAGISGVCAAAHLLDNGLSVTLLERCDVAGGVWHFDEESAHEPPFPSVHPSKGDFVKYEFDSHTYDTPPRTPDSGSERSVDHTNENLILKYGGDARISHAPPGPCYSSLRNNVPLTLMKTSLLDWPKNLEEFVGQKHLEQYIQQTSKVTGVESATEYNTRVEDVTKVGNVWKIRTALLHVDSWGNTHVSLQTRDFDAVVVATGHYQMPRVPDIPGLNEWREKYPTRIRHSKTYRSAKGLEGKRALLIGTGVSSCDIAKDLAVTNTETYQSSRGGSLDLPTTFLPDTTLRVGPVARFTLNSEDEQQHEQPLCEDDPLPGYVTLQNGSRLCGLHRVILATGYITSYPFLSQYHSDTHPKTLAGDDLLVTSEGDMVHNLHKDIFYIEDPTLTFVGVPYHNATFSLFDFQAQIVARYLGGHLELPSGPAMRAEYKARVEKKGLGRDFHSLRGVGEEIEYVGELVEWANRDALKSGARLMSGHDEVFMKAYATQKERVKFLVGSRRVVPDAGRYDHVVLPETIVCG